MTGKASQSLKIKFKRSSKKVWDLSERPSNNQLLELYALFKQATDGDCQGRASGGIRERAKWKAWNAISGMSESEAMEEYKSLTGRIKFRIFTALSMPAAWFSGLRLDVLNGDKCVTSLPGGWRSQNPFKTMYWAVQGMGAELATGAAPFAISRSMDEKLRMFVISTEAKFVKRAKGRITFICADVSKAREAIEESLETGEAVDVDLISVGKDSSGDVVSEWVFKWNLLAVKRK